jgi:2'-5' RNA ligase
MRLFTAVDIPPEVVRNLDALIARLRPAAPIKWSPAGNLHITTKFIGEWREDRRGELEAALAGLPPRPRISIEVSGVGFFPNPRSPRVFWAGVHGGGGLAELARETEEAVARLGVEKESRPFSPHLTLARIKEPVPLDGLRQAIADLPSTAFGGFTADRFFLYHSRLERAGSVYTKLSEYRFGE